MDSIMKRCESSGGYTLGQEIINHLLFADDLLLLADDESGLQRAPNSFNEQCQNAGMKISTEKTEVMVISRTPSQCTLHVSGVPLKQVERFKYLGFTFSSDRRQDRE